MTAPDTEIVGLDVKITWTAQDNGGRAITGYKVYIKDYTGTYIIESTYCSVTATTCSVPLLHL